MYVTRNDYPWMQPALDIIKRTDPSTYARMQASHWPVCVADGPDDIEWVARTEWAEYVTLLQELPSSYGATAMDDPNFPPPPAATKHATFLNRPNIEMKAEDMRVPVADFLADVLVHEFTHNQGQKEPAAFEAGTRFARKLPASDAPIAQLSQDTLQYLQEQRMGDI